jgi:hypothetical protein
MGNRIEAFDLMKINISEDCPAYNSSVKVGVTKICLLEIGSREISISKIC